ELRRPERPYKRGTQIVSQEEIESCAFRWTAPVREPNPESRGHEDFVAHKVLAAYMSASQTLHSPWPPRSADARREANLCPPRPDLGDRRGSPHLVGGDAGFLPRRSRTPGGTRYLVRELFDLPGKDEPPHGMGENENGCRHQPGAGRRDLDQSLLFQDSEGITHLVLREVQQFGQADDADRLVLHDRLEHRHMTLQELDLGLNLAGERAPAGHELPPLHNVTWSVITWPSLKRSTHRRCEERHVPIARLTPTAAPDRDDSHGNRLREESDAPIRGTLGREAFLDPVVDELRQHPLQDRLPDSGGGHGSVRTRVETGSHDRRVAHATGEHEGGPARGGARGETAPAGAGHR